MERTRTARIEKAAQIASIACAIHCAVFPIVIAAGASGAFSWLANEPVEWGLVLFAAVVGTVSAWRGFRTHGNAAVAAVLAVAALALVLLTWSHDGHAAHAGHAHAIQWLLPATGIALGVALFVNRRLCAACHDCAAHA